MNTAPSPLASLNVIEQLLTTGPASISDLAVSAGLPRKTLLALVAHLQRVGLLKKAADRPGTCSLNLLPTLPHQADRMTTQLVLARVDQHRTLLALEAATHLPRPVIGDILRRALTQGGLTCTCVGSLAMFSRRS